MPLPFLFANVSTLATPALDANYAALGALTPIPCDVAGTDALTMTPLASTATVASYSNYMQFTGIAINDNTSSVTATINAVGVLPVFKDSSSGPVALTGGEIVATCAFGLMYDLALDSGNGGFHLILTTGSGGGVTVPGGSNTQIQFNDAGAFGGNAQMTFDKSLGGTLALFATNADGAGVGTGGHLSAGGGEGGGTSGNGGGVFITGGGATTLGTGGAVEYVAGASYVTGNGGRALLQGGDGGSTSGDGGFVQLLAGAAVTDGSGGTIQVFAGNSKTTHNGGPVNITAGNAGSGAGTGVGGNINLTAGNGGATSGAGGEITVVAGDAIGTNSNGGDVRLAAGAKTGSGTKGHIKMLLEDFADDTAAAAGGVPITGLYRTASAVKVRVA